MKLGNSEYIVLFVNESGHSDEWEHGAATLEATIKQVKVDNRWSNYGRGGAIIVKAKMIYSIMDEVKERFFTS